MDQPIDVCGPKDRKTSKMSKLFFFKYFLHSILNYYQCSQWRGDNIHTVPPVCGGDSMLPALNYQYQIILLNAKIFKMGLFLKTF